MPTNLTNQLRSLNERVHIWLGLYLTVFLWLFAVSGLLLNHSGWKFAEFWDSRHESTRAKNISRDAPKDDLSRARHLMRQLGIAGEIEWTSTSATDDRFEFRVVRPGHIIQIVADFPKQTATVNEISVNGWGSLRMLHTFSGVKANDLRAQRDWWLTKLWSFSMDTLCVGLVLLVLTSWWMAFGSRKNGVPPAIVLALGAAMGAFFVFGLRLL
jgi:hypothetical protein